MKRERAEKKARQYLFDAMPANGPAFNFDSVSSYMTDFALAMMEKQREEDIETAMDHQCRAWHELCDCRGKIADAIRAENSPASLVGTPPIICESCGKEINPDYEKCIKCG